ncbi:E3 ubiquitin-protein ligase UBR4 isoform X2 [Oopsacas minuta]|uniref:E3 ubiquitin-protein ligase UBR4 isoform X2 n=1 Tax=Oopsacas minuta TaxID=111878 RepID=A0AAV7JZM8_9METZ|nr:E3 ubiquitin-protein ligase UBR4 isoform X2 [Oopsacas minuta]
MMFCLTNCADIQSSFKCFINNIDYHSQISILQCISICLECGINRPENWQLYCTQNNITLPYLLLLSRNLHEEIAGSILHLVCCAICGFDFVVDKTFGTNPTSTVESKSTFPDYLGIGKRVFPNKQLVEQLLHISESIFGKENNISLRNIVSYFLLDAKSLTLRVLSQAFFWAVFSTSVRLDKNILLGLFWSMSEYMLTFGQKATQFVELLSHCTLVSPPEEIQDNGCITLSVNLLKRLNEKVFSHPNSNIYQILSTIVELDGYFLESQPCLICNNPEV